TQTRSRSRACPRLGSRGSRCVARACGANGSGAKGPGNTGGGDRLYRDLCDLVRRNPSGSEAGMRQRRAGLRTISARLEALGFRGMRPRSLGGRHVWALVGDWHARGLSSGTMKNMMVHLRWWAGAVGKGSVLMRDNARYGIEDRRAARGYSDGLALDPAKLAAVRDERVRLSLELQAAFGLRREEAIKFRVDYADRGDRIVLRASWCKGGRARAVPILEEAQRELLDRVHAFAGRDSLIRPEEKYVQQMRRFERDTRRAGIPKSHRLRHGYGQRRYRELAGFPCPAAGGRPTRDMMPAERRIDRAARQTVARELGHARLDIASTYLG
ncbi:MAG: hypothetical protein F4X35_12680, partial [Alphaproteobacteria bacterium]|nr:hypothetical protein [Alphaproteobacteria bacterium]